MNETQDETQDTSATPVPRQIDWRLLHPYARGLQIMGWAMVTLSFFAGCQMLRYSHYYFVLIDSVGTKEAVLQALNVGVSIIRKELLPGLVLLVLAQFMRCLGDRECPPGRILRYGPWILLVYAVLQLESLGVRCYDLIVHRLPRGVPRTFSSVMAISIPVSMQAAIVLGAALILRRLVAVIEESKTLV